MNSSLRRLTALLLALTVFCAVAGAEGSALLTSADGVYADVSQPHQSTALTADDVLMQETDKLGLYYRGNTGVFAIEDKQTGYVFTTGREDEWSDQLSKKWKAFASALCVGDFVTLANLNTFQETPARESIQVEQADGRICVTLSFEKAQMTMAIYLWLEEDALCVSIPDDEMQFADAGTALNQLYVLPFLGASFQGEGGGYIFMPDGSGALIRFDAPMASRALTLRAYGKDAYLTALGEKISMTAELAPKGSEDASLPVIGLVHGANQNAVGIWPDQGAEYCDLYASPAGNNNLLCSYACFRAVYREIYQQPLSDTENFTMVQSTPNRIDLKLRYTFLAGEEASYVGIACRYRDAMLEAGELHRAEASPTMQVMIDCLMQESVKAVLGTSTEVMTTFDDVVSWVERLEASGVQTPILVLEGTADGGVSRAKYDDHSLSGALGEIEALLVCDAQVLLGRNFLKYYEKQLPEGQRAYAVTRRFMVTEENAYLDDQSCYLRMDHLTALAEKAAKANEASGIASDDLGSILCSNFRPKNVSRTESMQVIRETLSALSQAGTVALSQPGAYALPYLDMAYDMPLSNSSYEFETDAVPFLQIVLSGCVPMFSRSQVAGSASVEQLLRMIDFNLYPHYTLTAEHASALGNSNSNALFATCADDLLDGLAEEYAYLNAYLTPVSGQRIVSRTCPADGISVTCYENGYVVAVNYLDTDYADDRLTIPAKSAVLMQEGGIV